MDLKQNGTAFAALELVAYLFVYRFIQSSISSHPQSIDLALLHTVLMTNEQLDISTGIARFNVPLDTFGDEFTAQMTQPTVSKHQRTTISQPGQGPILPDSARQKAK